MAKVMLIDDELETLEIHKSYLENEHEVYAYSSGSEALDYVPFVKPDVILLDIEMPFMDGFENFIVDEYVLGCYQQQAVAAMYSAKTGAYNDDGVITLTPYEGKMFAVLPYNNNTWLFRPFELKANSNYEVSIMGRQDCDFGMNLHLAYSLGQCRRTFLCFRFG